MEGCDCAHEAAEHAPLQDFGAAICLVADCDCDGPGAKERRRERNRTGEMLVQTIASVLKNPMPRTIDDMSRNIAAAIVANFKVEEL